MTPPWRYRLLVRGLSPLLLAYTAWRAARDGGWRYWWQRLGVYRQEVGSSATRDTEETLWVHAASVGEIMTVLPLIRAWKTQCPDTVFLVTTGTPTGAAVLQKQAIPDLRHQYLPVDFPGAGRRFVAQLRARRGWIVETEIWPWLYAHCAHDNIELTLVNGRLSDRTSTQSTGLLASSYRQALSGVQVLARSQNDAERFVALGAKATRVQVAGNLKYADSPIPDSADRLLQRDYVLAASTHDDEERQLAEAWLAQADDEQLLVIAPRHPERGRAIQRDLQTLGIRVSLRSAGEQPRQDERIHLADTLGEMQAWYQHADSTFVGGSLIERGGHNMLEPARHACPTVVGPHTGNFDDVMQLMRESDAIHVVDTADQVIRFLLDAADPQSSYRAMGQRALALSEDSRRVLQRYLQLLN
ncbi:3-deoxy-D-manno-octulosonic acid transferase [Granulosicoccus sp. 3-233]|uniref:3-deoxy-D-manno-octulosonic acid transferase n=1 Tax=Granulosicoccus sp. 3-233 TaxID=3417969 RepID=UPI003D3301EB